MSYTSKYTGQQIDNAIAEIPTIKNNINAVQGEVSTIKNTTIQGLSGEVATVKSQMSTLRNDLDINFNEHDNYELSINRIDSSLNTTIDNLGTLQNLVSNKVGIATYNEKMSELEKKDGELASLISEGDLNTLNSCMEAINSTSGKITVMEANILANQNNITAIKDTTIPSIENNISNINTTITTLDTTVQNIANDYITSIELDARESNILNLVDNTYATQANLTNVSDTLTNSYYTITQIEAMFADYIEKTKYNADMKSLNDTISSLNDTISSLNNTISSLEERLDELEKKIDNNEGWLS